jgi:hypothetical protein
VKQIPPSKYAENLDLRDVISFIVQIGEIEQNCHLSIPAAMSSRKILSTSVNYGYENEENTISLQLVRYLRLRRWSDEV